MGDQAVESGYAMKSWDSIAYEGVELPSLPIAEHSSPSYLSTGH